MGARPGCLSVRAASISMPSVQGDWRKDAKGTGGLLAMRSREIAEQIGVSLNALRRHWRNASVDAQLPLKVSHGR